LGNSRHTLPIMNGLALDTSRNTKKDHLWRQEDFERAIIMWQVLHMLVCSHAQQFLSFSLTLVPNCINIFKLSFKFLPT
jgi:hypothetical protein